MRDAAARSGVRIVTGDTKVVDKGKGDGLFINTAGIGVIEHSLSIAPGSVRAGDAVLVSGDLGRHGMAIMSVREGLEFQSKIESDSAPVSGSGAAAPGRRRGNPLPARLDAGRAGQRAERNRAGGAAENRD